MSTLQIAARDKEIERKSVHVNRMTLYHGSTAKGVTEFKAAGSSTLGIGVYLTPNAKQAEGYARHRQGLGEEGPDKVVYKCEITDLVLLDIRDGIPKSLSEPLREYVWGKIDSAGWGSLSPEMQHALLGILDDINGGRDLRLAIRYYHRGEVFTAFLKGIGYDGLIGKEGGEGQYSPSNPSEGIGTHETYLIFDPKNVKILEEHDL
ncbi:MAG: hypothetical protein KGH98_02110 [Candidatus Micrarchaeota archaeon]|nr:hypothetical protein [Candidatus Micrarchaeota archaeon]